MAFENGYPKVELDEATLAMIAAGNDARRDPDAYVRAVDDERDHPYQQPNIAHIASLAGRVLEGSVVTTETVDHSGDARDPRDSMDAKLQLGAQYQVAGEDGIAAIRESQAAAEKAEADEARLLEAQAAARPSAVIGARAHRTLQN